MDEYKLDSRKLYEILKKKGINSFHHANTVLTSKSFIEARSMLSRGHVEKLGLFQTEQASDAIDKKFNVWNDIFLDGLDLHKHFSRNSPYGPIMFLIDLKILHSPNFPHVYITKSNPTVWNSTTQWSQRYYSNLDDFDKEYRNSKKVRDGQIMFTFKNIEKGIKLNKYCHEILVDNPNILSRDRTKSLGIVTMKRIEQSLKKNGLSHIPVRLRHQGERFTRCWCSTNYLIMRKSNLPQLKKLFSDKPQNLIDKP